MYTTYFELNKTFVKAFILYYFILSSVSMSYEDLNISNCKIVRKS